MTRSVLGRLVSRADAQGLSGDELRERRLGEIKQIAESFTYDLGLLIAGHEVDFERYLAPHAVARLRAAVEPFLASGDAMRPNFGEYGELRIEGNLLDSDAPVVAHIEFDDQSVRETADGDLLTMPKRRIHVMLVLDIEYGVISDFDLRPATAY